MQQLEINDLIRYIKKELTFLSEDEDIFFIDEINLEVNFIVSGTIDGGFHLGVVTLDSNVNEQRIQKISVKLLPIFSKEEILEILPEDKHRKIIDLSSKTLFKGNKTTK